MNHTTDSLQACLMIHLNDLVVQYVSAWNETDSERRRQLIGKVWTENGTYVDAHRRGDGHDGINSMIQAAQQQFPQYHLRLVSGIEAHTEYVRFSWAAGGAPESPLYIGGTDFGIIASDGRFRSVVGFVDAAPVMA
jgi:hypothetical protein